MNKTEMIYVTMLTKGLIYILQLFFYVEETKL